jgi:hypothetical protein
MWSTHPASFDREENAKRRYLAAPHDPRSAWLLFADRKQLEAEMRQRIAGERPIERLLDTAQTIAEVKAEFSSRVFNPRYRGSYLQRELARHARSSAELIGTASTDPAKDLQALYPPSLRTEVERMRELSEELDALKALRAGVFEATGGRLVHRGREIGRRALPAAISEVEQELTAARAQVREHDRRCRATHLAAAERLRAGWPQHLQGLIALLHYAEHARADLGDAHGLLRNVVAIVTADGRVSGGELKRLIKACNQLHAVLVRIHVEAPDVLPDPAVLARMEVGAWTECLEELRLPQASKDNINDWMQIVDGWVHAALGALNALVSASLEQLLHAEEQVAQQLQGEASAEPAPAASQVRIQYGLLLEGSERERQRKLGWWDRFQTADGAFSDVLRSAVAVCIVGAVIWASASLHFGKLANVQVLNGLGTTVDVQLGDQRLRLAPGSSRALELDLDGNTEIRAHRADGREIERFTPTPLRPGTNFIYSVAGATPLARVTASYGSAAEVDPIILGAPRWSEAHADFYFTEPPDRISTRGSGGDTRTAVLALADQTPEVQLGVLKDPAERTRLIALHTAWDDADAAKKWKGFAGGVE